MRRAVIAFLIAPLAVPAIFGSIGVLSAVVHSFELLPNPFPDTPIIIEFTAIAALLSYVGALVFGVPGYLWLREYGITTFWAWPALGFGAGSVTVLAPCFMVFLWTLGDPSAGNRFHRPALLGVIGMWVLLGGAFGAFTGAVHRLIAGPCKIGGSDAAG
jgi:hypothetical protein